MPFGLCSAPRICTLLLSVIAHALSAAGIDRLVRYLDDFLLIADTCVRMQHDLPAAQQLINDFGLVINPDKTEGPSQRIVFLGILLDSVARTLSCTPERVAELRTLLARASASHTIALKALATLIGKLQFAASVLPGARPFVRRMIDTLEHHRRRVLRTYAPSATVAQRTASRHRHLSSASSRLHFALQHTTLWTDRGFRADVRFWLSHLVRWNGTQRWRSAQSAPLCFGTDASLYGFGFYLESTPPIAITSAWPPSLQVGSGFCGLWSPQDANLHSATGHMTWCELFAVYAALFTYRTVLRDCCALFRVDNLSGVHILNRQATRSARLAGLLRQIYQIAVDCNISIYAEHRTSESNVLADFLSRPALHGDADIVGAWKSAYPSMSSRLRYVSVVHSHHFNDVRVRPSSTTSPLSP